jgi:UDP-2-acetamido-3-amino-2,3-dideoxy-glucuronate N-acetyltransferase
MRFFVIHHKAHVEFSEQVSPTATIWQFASVTGDTWIGDETVVSPFAMLHGPYIGRRCRISGGVMMGPGFVIGDDVFIGPNVTLCNDAWPRAHKTGYDVESLATRPAVVVHQGASIGANAVILAGVTIGRNAMIAAGSVVHADVPAGMLWVNGGYRTQADDGERMRYAK